MSIDIRRALTVDGWMTEHELIWLAEQATEHLLIAEIGCYKGRSTCALGEYAKGVVYAFDDFKGPRNGVNFVPFDEDCNLFKVCCDNLSDLISAEKVIICQESHSEISTNIQPDMVFIDGDHSYDGVKRDIAYWWPRLRPGGLMCGHDSGFDEVRRAIDELPSGYSFAKGTSIWYVKKPSDSNISVHEQR